MSNSVLDDTGLLVRVKRFRNDRSICSRPVSINDVFKGEKNSTIKPGLNETLLFLQHMDLPSNLGIRAIAKSYLFYKIMNINGRHTNKDNSGLFGLFLSKNPMASCTFSKLDK